MKQEKNSMAQNDELRDVMGTVAHMKKKGTLKFLLIALAIGAVLLILGSFVLPSVDNSEKENTYPDGVELIGFFEYKEMLEKEIESLCLGVAGVERVDAVVFFSEVGGSIYAQNTQSGNSNSEKSEYVIIGSGSNAHALYLGESLPKLSGIGIVCDTGGDSLKRNELLALLSSAYGLPMTRIYVSEAGNP